MAERVESYRFSQRFKKEYLLLPKEVQQAFDDKLQLFLQDMSHPPARWIWQFEIRKQKLTFDFL